MEPELRHLKTIRAIADAGSPTRAATALGLAQPALSAQLRRIERALGGAQFERGRHGVRATALGEPVLERTRIVLPAVSELQQEAARFARTRRDGERLRLRLGGTHGPLPGALVDRLADATPGTTVITCASWSERELAGLLAEGRLDFALAGACGSAPPPHTPRVVWEEIAVDPVFVMLADGHPPARGREIGLAALADEEWACVPGDGCFADCFTAACSGSTTGWHCGTVQQLNTSVTYQEGTVTGVTRTSVCAEPGDSGGSFLSGSQAQGVTSGGSGNCTSGGTTFFQPINPILQSYGLTLRTTGTGPGDPGDPGGTWSAGTVYQAGDTVTYGGATYRCLQSHQAQPGWEPANTPALWQRL